MVLLREVTIHISNRLWNLAFPSIRKGYSLCGFDFLKKGGDSGKKCPSAESGICVCVCEGEKSNSFEIHVIILSYIRNVNLPFKKDFKFVELLTETSFFLYFLDRPKNGEGSKLRRRQKYMSKSN